MRRGTALLVALGIVGGMALPAVAGGAFEQEADLIGSFPGEDLLDGGSASLIRTDSGVTARARLTGADPGVYTLWWVVWNNPEACDGPCDDADGMADFVNPDTRVAVGYAGGSIAGEDGKLNTTARLNEGAAVTGFPYGFEGVLEDASTEIHLVWHYHGEKVPGLVDDALLTFDGACDVNDCLDNYFAVFNAQN